MPVRPFSDAEKREWQKKRRAEIGELSRNVALSVVNIIREGLVEDGLGWSRPRPGGLPRSLVRGTYYKGVNQISLYSQARERGMSDLAFVTWNAIRRLRDKDGKPAVLLPGARPFRLICPRPGSLRPVSPDEDVSRLDPARLERHDDGTRWYRTGRMFWSVMKVWNVEETSIARPDRIVPKAPFLDNDFLEKFVRACGARVENRCGQAVFMKKEDLILMPDKSYFESEAAYYATLMHEFYHWTGSRGREERDLSGRFGSEDYAREEMRAEIFSAVCASLFGLRGVVRRQAGYLDSWKRVLHARPAAILLAASQAQNIVGAILDAACGRQPGLFWLRKRDFSAVPAPLKDDRLRQEAISASLREEMYPERTEEDGPERSPAPGR